MTYEQFRQWGYRSRLSEMSAGPSGTEQNAENTQIAASQQQIQLAEQQQQLSQQQYTEYQQDIQPLKSQLTALSSGDRSQALSAAMPVISQLSSGYDAAKQGILNSIPPGAARDNALAQLEIQKATTTSGTLASEIQQAPTTLANLGAGEGAFSLQQLGAALSGYSGASTSAGAVASEENAAQANKVGMISGLAGAAGSAAGGLLGNTSLFKSDIRLKTNIVPVYPMLDKIMRFSVVRFDYKSGRKGQIGVIAQDVKELIPEAVERMEDGAGTLMVDFSVLTAAAIKAVQELSMEVRDLKRRLQESRARTATVS